MIESGYGYDQRNGSFNAGAISNLGWAIAPTGTGTEFEFQISFAAQFPDGSKVFGPNAFRLLLQDNRGPETAVETGLPYILASPRLGPLFITRSASLITISWTGPDTRGNPYSLFQPFCAALAHVSLSVIVRLNTNLPGALSLSSAKYPNRSNW